MDVNIETLRRQVLKEKEKTKLGGNVSSFGGGIGGGIGGSIGGPLSRSSPSNRSTSSTFGYTSFSSSSSSSPAVTTTTPGGRSGFGRNSSTMFGNFSSFGNGIIGSGSGSGVGGSAIGSIGGDAVGSTSPLPLTTMATATPISDRKKVSMSMQSSYRSPGFGNAPVGGYGASGT